MKFVVTGIGNLLWTVNLQIIGNDTQIIETSIVSISLTQTNTSTLDFQVWILHSDQKVDLP